MKKRENDTPERCLVEGCENELYTRYGRRLAHWPRLCESCHRCPTCGGDLKVMKTGNEGNGLLVQCDRCNAGWEDRERYERDVRWTADTMGLSRQAMQEWAEWVEATHGEVGVEILEKLMNLLERHQGKWVEKGDADEM